MGVDAHQWLRHMIAVDRLCNPRETTTCYRRLVALSIPAPFAPSITLQSLLAAMLVISFLFLICAALAAVDHSARPKSVAYNGEASTGPDGKLRVFSSAHVGCPADIGQDRGGK
jgi:hypothetical protein